jgi:hypothetical protein
MQTLGTSFLVYPLSGLYVWCDLHGLAIGNNLKLIEELFQSFKMQSPTLFWHLQLNEPV